MVVTGGYTGSSTFTYEVKVISASSSAVSQFTWRKYLLDMEQEVARSAYILEIFPYHRWRSMKVYLCLGLLISGHTVGDVCEFTAHAGDYISLETTGRSLESSANDLKYRTCRARHK